MGREFCDLSEAFQLFIVQRPFGATDVIVENSLSGESGRVRRRAANRFEFPFLDTCTLRGTGLDGFVELCREISTELSTDPFLAAFGHQWEFGADEDLVLLERFFEELEGRGAVFVEVRAVPGLAGVRAEAW
ncbi:MAG: hypothetical protein MAG715_01273 [Methanonatronarchaeales archaeon]|nr:hypothetical protein [Methanonatronarchaeales archaeon]